MDSSSLPKVLFAGSGGQHGEVKVYQWDRDDHAGVATLVSRFPKGYSVYALAVSTSARYLAIGTRAGLVRVYPLSSCLVAQGSASCFEFFHHNTTPVLGVDFSTNDLLVTGGQDGTVRIWSIAKRQQMAEIRAHPEGLVALQTIRSLFLATIGRDGTLKLWDLDTLSCFFQSLKFQLPKTYALTSLAFSAASRKLYHPTGSGELIVYDVLDKLNSRTVKAHDGDFCAVAVGSRYLATAGMEDRRIRLWNLVPDAPVFETAAEGPVISLAWLSEKEFVTVYADGNGRIWRIDQNLSRGDAISGLDLRSSTGLSERCVTSHATRERWTWRQEQLRRADELAKNPSAASEPELRQIISDLEDQGFPSEALVFRAYLAGERGSKAEYLRKIDELLSSLDKDQPANPKAKLSPLYAAFDLLVIMAEPAVALEYAERALQIDPEYHDLKERCHQCRGHPLLERAAENVLRLELTTQDAIKAQIEFSTALRKRFLWNLVIHRYNALFIGSEISLEDLAMKAEGWKQSDWSVWDGRQLHQERWLIRPVGKQKGLSLGVQVNSLEKETHLNPCLVFSASESQQSGMDVIGFNDGVADVVQGIQTPDESTVHRWLEPLAEAVRVKNDSRF